jgi:5,10-methylenetetrahydromethanopterin reductase
VSSTTGHGYWTSCRYIPHLDDLAPNRVICGIGAWWDPLAKNVGIIRNKPLNAMRETVMVMKKLL